MIEMKPESLEPVEVSVLLRFAPVAVAIGLIAGFIAAVPLWDTVRTTQGFWTELLKIAGLATLPIIAFAARVPRIKPGTQTATAFYWLIAGLVVALALIMLCLAQIAVTAKDGVEGLPSSDFLVTAALMGLGATLGTLAVGVASEVFDKIDTE